MSTSSARDLMALQGEIDKNAATIASLTHETAETLAAVAGSEKAAKKHHAALCEELQNLRRVVDSIRAQVQGGPTVRVAQYDAAAGKLARKQAQVKEVQTEVRLLESVLKEFIHEEPLALRELFDTEGSKEDEVALHMVLDQRRSYFGRHPFNS